jgi:hypothetical protein
VTSAAAHFGTFSVTDVGNIDIRQNFSATPTSTITQVSFWVEHPDPARSLDAIDFFYSDGTSSEFLTAFTSTDSWEFFDVTSDLAPGKSLTGFSFFGYNTSGLSLQRTFLDDVTINVTTPEPQSLLLLASGLLGFIGFFGFRQWKDHSNLLSAKK